MSHKAAYFFCTDLTEDRSAHYTFAAVQQRYAPKSTPLMVDGRPVLRHEDTDGNVFLFVQTQQVLSHNYPHYLPILNTHFADCDVAGIVNWHEGVHAPEAIFCAHTTGDMLSGHFGAANPRLTRAVLLALEASRQTLGLEQYTTLSEATHWSGLPHGGNPALLRQYPVPVLDIEIGSSPPYWTDPQAADAVALALTDVFNHIAPHTQSLLCAGGVHFERSFTNAVLATTGDSALAVSHILPNQWLESGHYDTPEGLKKLRACVATIAGGVDAIILHAKMKGTYKNTFRALGAELGVPVRKHKALRQYLRS